ncbi:hypothetical protein ScPMuIL_015651 [Solemya velum]
MAAVGQHVTSLDQGVSTIKALSWSDDNRLALSTDGGIQILELQNSPYQLDPTFSFYKSFIPLPTESLVLFEFNQKQRDSLKIKSNLNDYYKLSLERDINLVQIDRPAFRAYKSAEWSPAGADNLGRCVLAALTFDHRLVIFSSQRSHAKWVKVMDLSVMYSNLMNENKPDKQPSSATIHQYVNQIATTEISWSPAVQAGAILAMGMKNGAVVLWKFKFPVLSESDCEMFRVIESTHNVQISSMSWYTSLLDQNQKGVLAVGYHSGVCDILHINMLTQEGAVDVCPVHTETELIEVSCMLWTDIQTGPILFVCKECYILVYMFNIKGGCMKLLSQKTVMGEHIFPCTGLCVRENAVFLSSKDGLLQKATIQVDRNNVNIEFTEIPLPVDSAYEWTYCGISVSKSGYYLGVAAVPSSFFDHLKFKHPTKVFVSIIDNDQDLKKRLEKHIRTDEVSLHGIREPLEVFRQYLCVGDNLLPAVTDYISRGDQWSSLSVKALGLIRYFLLTIKQHIPKGSDTELEEQNLTNSNISKIGDVLRLHHIRSCLEKARKHKHLEITEKLILSRMFNWVEKRPASLAGAKLKARIREIQRNYDIQSATESCQICGGYILSMQYTLHVRLQSSMCCQTFITCQSAPYRKCATCRALAVDLTTIADVSWIPDKFYCTLCGGLLL